MDVYHLDTNASYWFRVWASNALGAGPAVEVLATTLYTDQDAGTWPNERRAAPHRCAAITAFDTSLYTNI